jgi:putative endonuclease
MKRRFYVYILHCADDSFYVGVTNNLERRFAEHSTGMNEGSYTASRLPVKLVWHETYKYILDAIAREKNLKGWSRKKKLALIEGRHSDLPALAKKIWPRKKI